MKLKLTTNLGLHDAGRFGLDHDKATEGAAVDVKQDAADELLRRGWALDPATYDARYKGKPEPKVEAGAAAPTLPPVPDFDAMSVQDLKAYADANKVPGLSPTSPRDDMVKAARKHAAEKAPGNA